MLFCNLVILIPLVAATDIVFELERWSPIPRPCVRGFVEGFPATAAPSHGSVMNETIADRCFIIETHLSDIRLRFTSLLGYTRDISLVATGGNHVRLDRSSAEVPRDWRQLGDRLGVGMNSDFGRTVGSMFLLPPPDNDSNASYRMIIGAQDPPGYCVDRQLVLVDAFEGVVDVGITLIQVDGGVAVSSFINTATHGFWIESSEPTTIVPQNVLNELVRAVRELGMTFRSVNELEVGCEGRIHLLPTIQFQINFAVNIYMSANDYVTVDNETGRCSLQLLGSDRWFRFGSNFVERVGLYFNYSERRIGFCDPISL